MHVVAVMHLLFSVMYCQYNVLFSVMYNVMYIVIVHRVSAETLSPS
jgi:hypothetical protein